VFSGRHRVARPAGTSAVSGYRTPHQTMIVRVLIAVSMMTVAAWVQASAQATGVASVLTVFRAQAGSISSDVLMAIGEPFPVAVRLSVEEAPLASVVEYAFLETCAERGITVRTAASTTENSNHVRILVLEQRAAFDSLDSGVYLRTVRTTCEGRFSPGDGGAVRYLGLFEQTTTDSVESREPMPWTRVETIPEEEPSVFSKALAPLVIISGAALIVYLFFAVRSS